MGDNSKKFTADFKKSFFVKSMEEDLTLKRVQTVIKVENGVRVKHGVKVPIQSIEQIIRSGKIIPNTKSFGQDYRLSTTILNENYKKSYRPQGIIFQTDAQPDYISPADLMVFAQSNKVISRYYLIKDNLMIHYNHPLIKGFEKFLFEDPKKMFKQMPSPEVAWDLINKFRVKNDFKALPKSNHMLAEYNEAVFHEPIKIFPVALFGRSTELRERARALMLPSFKSAKEFYEKLQEIKETRKETRERKIA